MLTAVDENGIIFPIVDGFLSCPRCGKQKLLRVTHETEARALPVYCKNCRREYKINIRRA